MHAPKGERTEAERKTDPARRRNEAEHETDEQESAGVTESHGIVTTPASMRLDDLEQSEKGAERHRRNNDGDAEEGVLGSSLHCTKSSSIPRRLAYPVRTRCPAAQRYSSSAARRFWRVRCNELLGGGQTGGQGRGSAPTRCRRSAATSRDHK